jgi:hypothetical protein
MRLFGFFLCDVRVKIVKACIVNRRDKVSLYLALEELIHVKAFKEWVSKDFVNVCFLAQALLAVFFEK